MKNTILIFTALFALGSCTIIRQGEVGVKRKLGRLTPKAYDQGVRTFNPLLSTIIKVPVRTVNLEVKLALPSREGLTIQSEISILYRIEKASATKVINNIGLDYENVLILPVFRSAAADVTSKFYAKDMHSGERALIERNIRDTMMEILGEKGFIVENVLLKAITLPAGLSAAIEEKLRAEQEAQRMEFTKQKEKLEAERKTIAAEGDKKAAIIAAQAHAEVTEIKAEGQANAIKIEAEAKARANEMLTKGLTPEIMKNNQIEAFKAISTSGNTKVIITDGKTPLLGIPDGPVK
ncbi:MAG: prohibitin family protein [Bacteroidetes bacterium]|nr:prohibitin family protein [Bacteroidota bacterium]